LFWTEEHLTEFYKFKAQMDATGTVRTNKYTEGPSADEKKLISIELEKARRG
jgi:hypothetical protein